jgi:Xaa-Pro aminopeptidase
LPVEDEPVLIVDIFDYSDEHTYVEDVRPSVAVPYATIEAVKEKHLSKERLGLVGRNTFLAHTHKTFAAELGHDPKFEPADDILEQLRRIKSESEVRLLRNSASVGVGWVSTVLDNAEPGRTEADLIGEGLRYLVTRGGYPYDTALAAGPHAHRLWGRIGLPPWDWTRPLELGDLVHVDAWGPVQGYYTDFSRSTVVGRKASAAQLEILEASVALIGNIIEHVAPGAVVGDLYEHGAAWLVENGFGPHVPSENDSGTPFGELFPSFGHCIGLGIEPPWIVKGESTLLEANMVLAIETVLHRPDVGAAAFEQDVLVTPGGCEVLTQSCPSVWWS